MKILLIAALILASFGAQAQTPIDEAFAICRKHLNMERTSEKEPRFNSGWGQCDAVWAAQGAASVKRAEDAAAARDAAEKKRIDDILKGLKK